MKTPVEITAIHLNVAYTTDHPQGRANISVEIDGKWIELISEKFDPAGFHISHIVEGAGILARLDWINN